MSSSKLLLFSLPFSIFFHYILNNLQRQQLPTIKDCQSTINNSPHKISFPQSLLPPYSPQRSTACPPTSPRQLYIICSSLNSKHSLMPNAKMPRQKNAGRKKKVKQQRAPSLRLRQNKTLSYRAGSSLLIRPVMKIPRQL